MVHKGTMFRVGAALGAILLCIVAFSGVRVALAADTTLNFDNGGTATLHDDGTITGTCYVYAEWSDPAGDGTTENFTKVEVTMPDGQKITPYCSDITDACAGPEVGCTRPGNYPFKATPRSGEQDWYEVYIYGYSTSGYQDIHYLKWHCETVGWATVTKSNSNTFVTSNNPNYGNIEDAVFTVYKGSTSQGTIRYRNGAWTELKLKPDTYTMKETTVPTGFKTPNPNSKSVTVKSGETTKVAWVNEPYTPHVQIIKTGSSGDAALDARVASNPYYDLAGAQFKLYKSKNLNDPAKNANNQQFTLTVSKQSDGSYKTNIETMPAGTYYVREIRAPNSGYLIDTDGDGTPDIEDANPTDYWYEIYLPADDNVHTITWNDPPFFPEVDLTKYTSQVDPILFEAVKDNPCYDILGAQFTLYETNGTVTKDIHGNNVVLTVDSSSEHGTVGHTQKIKILPGDYYLRETRAPNKGFRLDADGDGMADEQEELLGRDTSGHKNVTVTLDDQTFTWTNDPMLDPNMIFLVKYDSVTGKYFTIPEGDASLNGAEYRFSYYKGIYTKVSDLPSTPDATAVWTTVTGPHPDGTVSSGTIDFVFDAPSSGTWKYHDDIADVNYVPLGTLVIQEVKPPVGYLIDPNQYIVTALDDGTHFNGSVLNTPYQQDGTPGNSDWNSFFNQYQLNGDQSGVVSVE